VSPSQAPLYPETEKPLPAGIAFFPLEEEVR